MDYKRTIVDAMEFIHGRFHEEIKVGDISEGVYLSPSYFSMLFRTFTGYTVKEYVNRYRLYRAASALKSTDKRIITITFEMGFSSQQAMTKKFSRVYGVPPAKFRKLNPAIAVFPPKNILDERGISMEMKKCFENVTFMKKDSYFVVGIETDIDYNRGTDNIGTLYERWNGEGLEEVIQDRVDSNITYGITHETEENDTAKYTIAVEVTTLDNIKPMMVGRKIEGCEYAVFEPTLEMVTSGEFWKYFHGTWLKEQNLQQPDAVLTKNKNNYPKVATLEVYDEKFEDEKSKIKIYAPILR